MKEEKENIWNPRYDSYWRVIPINCQVNDRGFLIMGKGLAEEAAKRYYNLDVHWGTEMRDKMEKIPKTAKHLFVGTLFDYTTNLIGFPTKYHWRDRASLILIENNLKHLVEIGKGRKAIGLDFKIVCPYIGCGLGNLDWESQVRPLMEKYFGDDDNFIVVHQ